MALEISTVLFENKSDVRNVTANKSTNFQESDRSISFEEKNSVDQFLENEAGLSKFDRFFDETVGQRNFIDAFDSFDEVVFIDDETHVNLDRLDDELANREHYR